MLKARKPNNDFAVTVKGNFNYIDTRRILTFLKLEELIRCNLTFHLPQYSPTDNVAELISN